MKTAFRFILLAVLLPLAFCFGTSDGRVLPVTSGSVSLGQGYDKFSGDFCQVVASGQRTASLTPGAAAKLYYSSSHQVANNDRGMDIEARLGLGPFKAAGSVSQSSSSNVSSVASVFTGHVTITKADSSLSTPALRRITPGLGAAEFANRYGSEYVYAITYGGILAVEVNVAHRDARSRRALEARLDASGWGQHAALNMRQVESYLDSNESVSIKVSRWGAHGLMDRQFNGFGDYANYVAAFEDSVMNALVGVPIAVALHPTHELDAAPNDLSRLLRDGERFMDRFYQASVWEARARKIVNNPNEYRGAPSSLGQLLATVRSQNARVEAAIRSRTVLSVLDSLTVSSDLVALVPDDGLMVDVNTNVWQDMPVFSASDTVEVYLVGKWSVTNQAQDLGFHRDWVRVRLIDNAGNTSEAHPFDSPLRVPPNCYIQVRIIDSVPSNDDGGTHRGNYLDNIHDPTSDLRVLAWPRMR